MHKRYLQIYCDGAKSDCQLSFDRMINASKKYTVVKNV